MEQFKPANIQGAFGDFWTYIREDRPHRWPAWGLAITIPGVILWFMADALRPPPVTGPQIIYVQSWPADRSDYDIRRDWLQRAREANEQNQQRSSNFGTFAETIGQEFDEDRADREFANAFADIAAMEREVDEAEREQRPIRTIQELRDLGLAPPSLTPATPPRDAPRRTAEPAAK
jgi:hypothetical protein